MCSQCTPSSEQLKVSGLLHWLSGVSFNPSSHQGVRGSPLGPEVDLLTSGRRQGLKFLLDASRSIEGSLECSEEVTHTAGGAPLFSRPPPTVLPPPPPAPPAGPPPRPPPRTRTSRRSCARSRASRRWKTSRGALGGSFSASMRCCVFFFSTPGAA